MSHIRVALVCLLSGVLVAACSTGANMRPGATATTKPTLSGGPSDAGIVGNVDVIGDSRNGKDGRYLIAGMTADGSSCGYSVEGDEFVASAINESYVEGELRSMFVSIPAGELPEDGASKTGISDGRAGFEFKLSSGVGTLYVGEPLHDGRTQASIDVTHIGRLLKFDYDAKTWDGVEIIGSLFCGGDVP